MNVLKLRYLVLSFSIFLCSINAYTETTDAPITNTQLLLKNLVQKYPNYTFTFNLPINVNGKNIILAIKIPPDLKFIQEYPGNPHIMQFGNKNELITITHQTGGKFQAHQSLDKIMKAMQTNSQLMILQQADYKYSDYNEGYRIIKRFDTQKKTTDIIYLYSASGPYDSASILYESRLPNEESLNTVMQKLENTDVV